MLHDHTGPTSPIEPGSCARSLSRECHRFPPTRPIHHPTKGGSGLRASYRSIHHNRDNVMVRNEAVWPLVSQRDASVTTASPSRCRLGRRNVGTETTPGLSSGGASPVELCPVRRGRLRR